MQEKLIAKIIGNDVSFESLQWHLSIESFLLLLIFLCFILNLIVIYIKLSH